MDISGLKDFAQKILQKLSIFRAYSPLLVPGVLVLIALLIFVPTGLISNKLKKQIEDKSIRMSRTIRSISEHAIARNQWKVEQQYQQALGADANQISLLAAQTTQRQLLSYTIFPEPKSTSIQTFDEFGQQFRKAIEQLLVRINAGSCPSGAEIDRSLPSSNLSGYRPGGRRPYRELKEAEAAIIDELCRAKAASASVYANPADLEGYEFWAEYKYVEAEQAVRDCWYWQLGYWIIEDIMDTIKATNYGSNSVLTSPVKRLLGVSFSKLMGATGRGKTNASYLSARPIRPAGGRMADEQQASPRYVYSKEDGLCLPWTGRICNEDIDVVHFNVRLIVSAEAILPFMKELCNAKQHEFRGFFGQKRPQIFKHNQITILRCKIGAVDRRDEAHWLYRYGEDAVVELDLICEYIFDRAGYDEIKPKLVQMVNGD